ncbi:glycoside hydrolase family 2 TIM barrel-domain containing protein [Flavobacterium sp. UMI-01]|uniref:glycoside hydrolase family 2 TIM barrel-domain containing protein n=1 Tax=Flavobacterium sp. UMI-01 TaxID=1441053 RepID=UPI00208B290E|nr:glycoside hydrolase family 2 TIM barrel-domain containing protein [Flavobacterium sp. UMI-01]GIZ09632.1 beta-galactosidase [Flavobacterium sp. UMI-01]
MMHNIKTKRIAFLLLLALFANVKMVAQEQREQDFNFDWKFQLQKDTKIATKLPLNDADWREVRLPHDWSVEFSFDKTKEGATGYLDGGVAWYQKHFSIPKSDSGKKVYILFDGVYNNAKFWLNGKLLGENPYGYSPTYFDLTPFLTKDGSPNVISVHVDHSRYADNRWYSGSGIYRNVKLITTNKLHIPVWGTFVTTPEVSKEKAKVQLKVKVANDFSASNTFELATKIIDEKGAVVAQQNNSLKIKGNTNTEFTQLFAVANPKLWDIETPTRYKAITTISSKGKVVDQYTTPFGIRTIEFKAGEGFFLNGKSTYMKGICIHHDGGLVGAAVPEGVWRRRLTLLKECGVNAIRTSHNPFSEEFLNLCDEMGFLVQNELFDEFDLPKDKRLNYHDRHDDYITRGYTEHFQKWGKSDLTRTLLRDRNHPSVVQWSIGNEIEWTYLNYRYITGFWKDPKDPQKAGDFWGNVPMYSPQELKKRYDESDHGKYKLSETAQKLSSWVRDLDQTRPTTANMIIPQVSHVSGYADAVDIAGYSYRNVEIPWAQKHFPTKQVTINECPGTWDDWKQVLENPGVFSMFMWTGIDYLGEANGKWPQKGWDGDLLDFAGFKKQGWNYFKSIWVNTPNIAIGTTPVKDSEFNVDELSGKLIQTSKKELKWNTSRANFHWNYSPGEMVIVEVSSNLAQVELFLNGRSLGVRSMSECPDRIFRWAVPYQAGTLTARAGFDGAEVKAELKTTSEPVKIRLTTDQTQLKADGYDVAHVIAQLLDKDGNEVTTSEAKLTFDVKGEVKVLGVDNGWNKSIQDYQTNTVETHNGHALLLIQSLRNGGNVSVNVTAKGLKSNAIAIEIK